MTNHSLLSPSTAHRWMICPGSVARGMTLPDEPSAYAQEGTIAHALAESMLNGTEYEVPPEYDTAELREHVQTYVDFVTLLGERVPGLKLVEGRKGVRKWRSEAAAIKAIEAAGIQADVYERKLLSPAKMEKLLKDKTITKDQWSALAPEITQETTRPTIADETDKRPAYEPQALDYPNMEEKENG